jgi:hypothetical protein
MLLEHTLEGRIRISRLDLAALCLTKNTPFLEHMMTWLGHAKNHIKLTRTVDGRGLLSTSPDEEAIAWHLTDERKIRRRALLPFQHHSLSLTLLAGKIF